jgi:hypothetical protein
VGDLGTLFTNFHAAIGPFYDLFRAVAWMIGVILAMLTAWEIKQVQDSRGQKTYTQAIFTFMAAVAFMYMPELTESFGYTAFGSTYRNPLAEDVLSDNGLSKVAAPLVRFVELVGYIAFARGWLIFRAIGQGQAREGATGRAITHMVGGILAVNIVIFGPTLGEFAGLDLKWFFGS